MKKVLGVFHQFIMDSNQVFYAVTASEWRMRDNDKAKLRKRYVDLALSHNLPGVLTRVALFLILILIPRNISTKFFFVNRMTLLSGC